MLSPQENSRPAVEPDTLVTLLARGIAQFADNRLFGIRDANGAYSWMSYRQFGDRVDHFRSGLAHLGVDPGDRVGYIGFNSVEWAATAFATYGLGAVMVPLYEKEITATIRYILTDAGIKMLVVTNPAIMARMVPFIDAIATLEHLVMVQGTVPAEVKCPGSRFAAIEPQGVTQPAPVVSVASADLAALIYTSGTTGAPKGVMLTHGNLISNVLMCYHDVIQFDEQTVSLSHLPWAHSFGQTTELYLIIYSGGSIAVVGSLETLAQDMQTVHPTLFISVPRLYHTLYAKINAAMEAKGGLGFRLFKAAIRLGRIKAKTGRADFRYWLLDRLVLRKIRRHLGIRRWEAGISGSARINPDIITFFSALGLPVLEGYGLTETAPGVSGNRLQDIRPGSVGRPLSRMRVMIDHSREPEAPDGEIVVYGPCVMQGYWNKPDQTRAVMTADGGLRTGDRGWLDSDGFLFVTGRFKEEYKLENGRYVRPAELEEAIKDLPWVNNCMVYGDGKPYNVLLVVPNQPALETIQQTLDLKPPVPAGPQNEPLQARLVKELSQHLQGKFQDYEIPARIALVEDDWTIENGMLTQTLKLKRWFVWEKYQTRILALYAPEPSVPSGTVPNADSEAVPG